MAALAVCPTGAVAEVYSCEIRETPRIDRQGIIGREKVRRRLRLNGRRGDRVSEHQLILCLALSLRVIFGLGRADAMSALPRDDRRREFHPR